MSVWRRCLAAWVLKFSADKLTKEVIGMARERKHPPRKRRRGRFRLFYQLLSLVAVAAAMVTACVIFFRVNQVEVQGNSHYDAQTIIDASGIQVGDNLVTMWEPDINDRICQKLPYVERVVLHRVLPDRVNLLVVERTAAATVEGGGSQWLLSADGYLLETTQEPQGVQITGIQAVNPQAGAPLEVEENSQSKAQVIPKLMSALEQAGKLSQCTQIDGSAAASLKVSYDIHQLKFPLHGDYERMLNLFQAALDSGKIPEGEAKVFDFTVVDNEVYVQNPKAEPSAQPSAEPQASAEPQTSADPQASAQPQTSAEPQASATPEP